jgi:hypothetical protein
VNFPTLCRAEPLAKKKKKKKKRTPEQEDRFERFGGNEDQASIPICQLA